MSEVVENTETLPEARPVSYGQERRLRFIDYRLRWEGRINRTDLTEHFNLSIPQASLDLAKYSELAASNLEYDRSSKTYLATGQFKALYESSAARRYLSDLLALKAGIIPPESSFAGSNPEMDWAPAPSRTVDDTTVEALVKAIRGRLSVKVSYQSMSSAALAERVLSPHALGYDGFRWHVRAYCEKRKGFADFVLARMLSISGFEASRIDPTSDVQWHTVLTLVLAPRPDLSAGKKRVIELDYGMEDGQVELPCRQAFLFYTLRRLGLQTDVANSAEQQIILKNRVDVQPYIDALSDRRDA